MSAEDNITNELADDLYKKNISYEQLEDAKGILDTSNDVYEAVQKSSENVVKFMRDRTIGDIIDSNELSSKERESSTYKAKKGFSNLKRLFKNTEGQAGIMILEGLANLYSQGMLTSNLTPEEAGAYTVICLATGLDFLTRVFTGCGIPTYIKAGAKKIANIFSKEKKADI